MIDIFPPQVRAMHLASQFDFDPWLLQMVIVVGFYLFLKKCISSVNSDD